MWSIYFQYEAIHNELYMNKNQCIRLVRYTSHRRKALRHSREERLLMLDIEKLRATGLTDGEILEVNQVTAYFCYANRTVLGLGVNTDGDILGTSPGDSDDPDNWNHA